MKNRLSILIAKLASTILHFLGRNAGTVPGRLALKFNPKVRDFLKLDGKLIVVTGTNGKTTTTNIIAEILTKCGKHVVVNSHGNNIDWGITTTLLKHARLNGEIDCDYLVLETDEHWVPVLYSEKNLQPDVLIILDFFRDQLDRAGEMETLVKKLEKFVKTRTMTLILNGDDPNVVRIGRAHTRGENFYYGLAKLPTSYETSSDKMEGIICPDCKTPLTYDYYQYSHLGRFHCETCGFENHLLDTRVHKISDSDFFVSNEKFSTTNPSLYNIYNLLAVLTLANYYDLDRPTVKEVFASYQSKNGRYQTFQIGGKKCTLNLCKNPTGFNVVLRTIKHNGKSKDLLLVLNDRINDGFDVSWIWDIDFSDLSEFDHIVCSGTRAFDMAIPVKCNNFDPKKIIVTHDLNAAVHSLLKSPNRKYIISNYSPLTQVQKILTKLEKQTERSS